MNIDFGRHETKFAVHEDLLCSSSKYFKRKLQKSRKPVEGDCSVCTEDVAGFTQISYCKGCGQNFHTKCIDDWLQRERTCPLCRLDWPLPLQPTQVKGLGMHWHDLHFNRYIQWLYTGDITSKKDSLGELLSAWRLAGYVEDSDYLLDAGRAIIEISSASQATIPCQKIVGWYEPHKRRGLRRRKFLVDLCAARPSLVKLTSELPGQFLLDLTQKLLSTRPAEGVDLHEALAEHLSLSEEGQESSED